MKMPKYSYHMALMFSSFITARHATLEEAAAYFKVPKSTLWDALERLTPSDRAASLRVAKENIHQHKKRTFISIRRGTSMKTVKDFATECLRTLVDPLSCPTYGAFRCWGCIHKTACILTATVAYDMILTGNL